MRLLSRICLAMVAFIHVNAQPMDSLFNQANQAFHDGQYEQAKVLYKELIIQQPEQFEIHFNLANTYYYLDSLAWSILHFEKALKIDPGNERALHNLQLCYLKSAQPIEPLPDVFYLLWWKQYLALFSADVWAKLAMGSMWVAVLLFFALYFYKRKLIKLSAYLFLFISLILVLTTWRKAYLLSRHSQAIVMTEQVKLYVSPGVDEEARGLLYEGMRVNLTDSLEQWMQVKVDEETSGWVDRKLIHPI